MLLECTTLLYQNQPYKCHPKEQGWHHRHEIDRYRYICERFGDLFYEKSFSNTMGGKPAKSTFSSTSKYFFQLQTTFSLGDLLHLRLGEGCPMFGLQRIFIIHAVNAFRLKSDAHFRFRKTRGVSASVGWFQYPIKGILD